MKNVEEQIINDFYEAWKCLDASLIIRHLSENFKYNSQWVFETLDSKNYADYITHKFSAIKKSGVVLKVAIVDDSHSEFPKMLMLDQNGNIAYYRIKVEEGKVVKGDLCMF